MVGGRAGGVISKEEQTAGSWKKNPDLAGASTRRKHKEQEIWEVGGLKLIVIVELLWVSQTLMGSGSSNYTNNSEKMTKGQPKKARKRKATP